MNNLNLIVAQREALLEQMRSIRSIKSGSITEQYLKVPQKGNPDARRGPYYVYCKSQKGRTISQRLKSAKEVEQAKADLAAHKRFVALCREFEELTERLGELERLQQDGTPEKKRRRSRLNKTKK